jgi:hypothetical protein
LNIVQTAISGKAEYICTLDEHFYEAPVVAFCVERGLTVISDLSLLELIRRSAREEE